MHLCSVVSQVSTLLISTGLTHVLGLVDYQMIRMVFVAMTKTIRLCQPEYALMAMAEIQEKGRNMKVFFTLLLVSCLLTSHWSKKVTWLGLEHLEKTLQGNMAKGVDT